MEKYESKQVQVRCSAKRLFELVSDFTNFTPHLAGKVEDWQATKDSCSFKIKGLKARLLILERDPFSCVKIGSDEGSPFEFFFWIQLRELDSNDTRMRLVLHAKLNMMLKMMVGSKIQGGLDQMAETVAQGLNASIDGRR